MVIVIFIYLIFLIWYAYQLYEGVFRDSTISPIEKAFSVMCFVLVCYIFYELCDYL